MKRLCEAHHISEEKAEEWIEKADTKRANYYNYYTGHTWGDMRRYDLTLNSSTTGIDGAVDLIVALVQARTSQDAKV